jgi:hypothetical protein
LRKENPHTPAKDLLSHHFSGSSYQADFQYMKDILAFMRTGVENMSVNKIYLSIEISEYFLRVFGGFA